MISWDHIDTVFLDMDGTLLDLHYDNFFWKEHVPHRYAQKYQLSFSEAKQTLYQRYASVEGTLSWYCLDYWARELGLDIVSLKREVAHLIALHPHVPQFLDAIREVGKRLVLLTNAHGDSLALKLEVTGIDTHFDRLLSSHELGAPKESAAFWGLLHEREDYKPRSTLMVDDNLEVLRSARQHGIEHLITVRQPDTKSPPNDTGEFVAIDSFRQITPAMSPSRR